MPLDTTDGFFESPLDQLLKWGDTSTSPIIQDFHRTNQPENKTQVIVYEPANIRITLLNQTTMDAIEDNVYTPDQVKDRLSIKVS